MEKYKTLPLKESDIEELQAGDYVYLTGTIYTARDAAHKRMQEMLDNNKELPFELKNNIIYYMGPSPARESLCAGENVPMTLKGNIIYYMGPSPARDGHVIGSAGPTTSSRMDKYAPLLMDNGLVGMIGKGKRSKDVSNSIIKNKAIYFAAVGGAGAILSKSIIKSEVIAYDDLGTEAIRKLEVKNFPVIVVIDSKGKNLYEIVASEYRCI